jgi:hypothetical protein
VWRLDMHVHEHIRTCAFIALSLSLYVCLSLLCRITYPVDDDRGLKVGEKAEWLALLGRTHDTQRGSIARAHERFHRRLEGKLEMEPSHGRRCVHHPLPLSTARLRTRAFVCVCLFTRMPVCSHKYRACAQQKAAPLSLSHEGWDGCIPLLPSQ